MRQLFSRIKNRIINTDNDDFDFSDSMEDEYIEVSADPESARKSKVSVRPFVLNHFEDVKPILDSLREGYTIALVNIRPLKDRDLVELKRAVNKLKKTCEAVEGDIAGFGDDWIAVTPSFASVYRAPKPPPVPQNLSGYETF